MNDLLYGLKNICGQYPLDEKRLIVPGYSAGNTLCESLARESGGWLNLRPVTVAGMAREVVATFSAGSGLTFLNGGTAATVVEKLFLHLREQGSLSYFTHEGNATGTVRAIASSLLEMRMAGMVSGDLSEGAFEIPGKGRDIEVLFRAYEKYLIEHNYLDAPGLLKRALGVMAKAAGEKLSNREIYILPSFLHMYPLEKELVRGMAGDRLLVIGGEVAEQFGSGTLDIYHAYGMRNEVREVFRRIYHNEIQLDKVTIAYTNSEYVPLIYSFARGTGMKITVSEGIPVTFTGPGRVLQGIIKWIKSDYSAGHFKDLLASGDVAIKGSKGTYLNSLSAIHILRKAGVGWGRERYGLLKSQGSRARPLYNFVARVLDSLPKAVEGGFIYQEFTEALADVLSKVVKIKNDADTDALSSLVASLKSAGELATFHLNADEALERVEDLVKGLRVSASDPKPGHIHVTGCSRVIWSNRPYTFFVGLDAGNFPGGSGQDPVLLDSERRRLHSGLPLGADKPLKKQYMMGLALATRVGRVTLSYSSHDIVLNRPVFPSTLLLGACRFLKEDNTLDYTSLVRMLGEPAGYCPGDGMRPIDELEWWLTKALVSPGLNDSLEAVRACYRNIDSGVAAGEERDRGEITEYDGWVPSGAEDFDPRNRKQRVFSSSRIEELAVCPFAYFLRYVLRIQPPEDMQYDPDSWLDAMQRGALLHELFYRFMRVAAEKKERPSLLKHSDAIKGIARELIEDYRASIPPPNDIVFEREAKDIYRCCELFLKCEEAERGSHPAFLEIPFGLGAEAAREAGYGLADPLKIDLDDEGTFFMLRGKIDRIDSLQDGTYSVLDYKTGGAGGYDENKYLDRGRQMQHALYSIAAEKIIHKSVPEKKPKVKLSGYYFPTEKGEGRRVLRSQTKRDELRRALNNLFDLLADGLFIAAEDKCRCVFCDYQSVCGYPRSADKTRLLIDQDDGIGASLLRAWKELMLIG